LREAVTLERMSNQLGGVAGVFSGHRGSARLGRVVKERTRSNCCLSDLHRLETVLPENLPTGVLSNKYFKVSTRGWGGRRFTLLRVS